MCAYWDIPSMIHGAGLYQMSAENASAIATQMQYHTARGEYLMGNFSLGRFPEMYITLEGTPFANCPALLVVIALLVIAGCVAPPLYVYRRKIYYKLVMVIYRRRKDKLARELKRRMKVYTEDTSLPLQSADVQSGEEAGMSCLICMDVLLDTRTTDLVILLDACGHRFHFKCILKWLDISDGCPICRKTVDVNDRKALRLVYLDCRPADGSSKAQQGVEEDAVAGCDCDTTGASSSRAEIASNNDSAEIDSMRVCVDIDRPTSQQLDCNTGAEHSNPAIYTADVHSTDSIYIQVPQSESSEKLENAGALVHEDIDDASNDDDDTHDSDHDRDAASDVCQSLLAASVKDHYDVVTEIDDVTMTTINNYDVIGDINGIPISTV